MGVRRVATGVLVRVGLPAGLAPRLRWAFLAICLFRLVSLLPQMLFGPEVGVGVRALATTLLVATGAWWVRCYRRGGLPLPGLLLEGAALAAVATVLGDPSRAVSLAYLAAMFHALARQPRRSAAFALVAVAVLVGATVAIPVEGPSRSSAEILFALVGIPAFMAVMHLVSVAGVQADDVVVRGRLIAQSGLDIASAADEDEARAVSRATVAALLAPFPGTSARLLPADAPRPSAPGTVWEDFRAPITADDQRVVRVVGPERLGDEVARALAIVATQLALALAKSVLTKDLARRAGEDPLTGLLNRRRLDEVLTAALDDAAGQGPCSVLTVDLDRFKEVNDAHGHAAGDALLVAVAARLRSHVREGDAVARLGGDEFLVLLTGEQAALRAPDLAQRLIASIAAPFEIAGRTVRVGASVGVALATAGQSPDEVMQTSDRAMYRAKEAGRGRVVLADGAGPAAPTADRRTAADQPGTKDAAQPV